MGLLCVGVGGAVDDFLVGHDEVHAHVVGFAGDGVGVELFVVAEGDADALEILLGEEAVIEAAASADSVAVAVEGHAGDDDHIDHAEGDGHAFGGFFDAGVGGHADFEAFDFDGFHAVVFPIDTGDGDVFGFLPGFDGEGAGFDFGAHGHEDHDGLGAFEFAGGGEILAGGEAAGVAIFWSDAGEEDFHRGSKFVLVHEEGSFFAEGGDEGEEAASWRILASLSRYCRKMASLPRSVGR